MGGVVREYAEMTPKTDTMSAIMQLNITARPEFLAEFSNQQLCQYLQRLRDTRERRAPWDALAFAPSAPWSAPADKQRRAS